MEKMVHDRAQRNHKAITVVGTVVPEATLPVRASACRFFFSLWPFFPAFRCMDLIVFR